MKKLFLITLLPSILMLSGSSQLIIDHSCTAINQIPQSDIEKAKQTLHIAYGHTSHGSQLTYGMTGLVEFANSGGRGLDFPENIFAWNNGGNNGALDLHDKAMGGDVGYFPTWYDNTIAYLNDPANADVNVIMWSWCGQVGGKYEHDHLWDEYLQPMGQLEEAYSNVTFIYMTGHLDYWDRVNTNAANDSIRSFCRNNNKVLFDFADIESYGPEGSNYENYADDGCNYYDDENNVIGNWAQEFQNTHDQGVDWYSCVSQHSEPYNANLKAYASWWMFASLAGWNYTAPLGSIDQANIELKTKVYPNPARNQAVFEIFHMQESNIRVNLISSTGGLIEGELTPIHFEDRIIYTINTVSLDPGVYYLQVIRPIRTESFKLVIVR